VEQGRGRTDRVASKRRKRPRLLADILTLAVVFLLMSAVYLLPPDTSLAEVERTGTLKVCVPQSYPPLVTGDPQQPGFDVSLVGEIAQRLGLSLSLHRIPEMGKDFNPRNWRVNRAQCEVLAGGVVSSATTQSFLQTVATGTQTGWAIVTRPGQALGPGLRVGVYPGLGGLDRLGLSAFLREHGLRPVLRQTVSDLQEGMESGAFDAAITESLSAQHLLDAHPDWKIAWMPASLGRYPLSLGLWKGDLTLKRAIVDALNEMKQAGVLAQLTDRYGIAQIATIADFTP